MKLHLSSQLEEADALLPMNLYLFSQLQEAEALFSIKLYLYSQLQEVEALLSMKLHLSSQLQEVEAILSMKQVPSTSYLDSLLEQLEAVTSKYKNIYSLYYMFFINHLAELEEQVHGVSTAVETLFSRKRIITLIEVNVEGQEITSSYSRFYRKLSDYYGKLEQHEEVKKCQNKILRKLNKEVADCDRGTCRYRAIGRAYYSAADFENSAHFLHLALQLESENISTMVKVNLMLRLYDSYKFTRNVIEAGRVLEELISLFPSIMAAPVSEMYTYSTTAQELIDLLKLSDKDEEATALEDNLIEVTLQIGARPSLVSTVEKTKKLVQHLYEQSKCIKAADLAVFALESFQHLAENQRDGAQELRFELQLLIGKAKICAGNISEGLDYIELMVDSLYKVEEYEHYLLIEVCPYIILRGRLWCLVGNMPQDILYASGEIIRWIFTIFEFDNYLSQTDSTQKTKAQVTQLSYSKELAVTTGQVIKIPLLSVISRSFFSQLYSFLSSVVMSGLVTACWILSLKTVQFVSNVLFIWLKQYLAYWILCMFVRMFIQSAHTIWNYVMKFIVLALCNLDVYVRNAVYRYMYRS